ncbi:MAG: hypothetical protein GEU82_07225 [Luteitalea sp.]|nr:hypothetical protein [Luteitalea sp.]
MAAAGGRSKLARSTRRQASWRSRANARGFPESAKPNIQAAALGEPGAFVILVGALHRRQPWGNPNRGGLVSAEPAPFIKPEGLLAHWQGHRRLTRRVIDAFPDEQLFIFSVSGMRPFGELTMEILTMAAPMVEGAASGDWKSPRGREPRPKREMLRLWDESTEQLHALWPQIPPQRFLEPLTAFGQYTDTLRNLILYVIDNEIHHRGQGYVYLRALGIDPPAFYDRS